MRISQKIIDELKCNNKLKGLVAIAHERTVYTIDRWIRTKDIKQLTAAVTLHLDIIERETGFTAEDIFIFSEDEISKT